jgi:hypothetical protein
VHDGAYTKYNKNWEGSKSIVSCKGQLSRKNETFNKVLPRAS